MAHYHRKDACPPWRKDCEEKGCGIDIMYKWYWEEYGEFENIERCMLERMKVAAELFHLDKGHAYALDLSAYWYAVIGVEQDVYSTLEEGFAAAEKAWNKIITKEIKRHASKRALKQRLQESTKKNPFGALDIADETEQEREVNSSAAVRNITKVLTDKYRLFSQLDKANYVIPDVPPQCIECFLSEPSTSTS